MSNKIGRNDKCPCGSQQKYKKCCLDSKIFEPEIVTSPEDYPFEEYNEMDELIYNIMVDIEDDWDETIF